MKKNRLSILLFSAVIFAVIIYSAYGMVNQGKEEDYISRIIKRLEYKEKDTREKMEILEQQMNAYMEKILC